jgi:hypothetical protein
MKFLLGWGFALAAWAAIAAAMGRQVFAGFLMGVIAVIGVSMAAGLVAASTYDRERGGEWEDERWDP